MTSDGRKIYRVTLEADERARLRAPVDSGKGSKERRGRAHILLLADRDRAEGGRTDTDIADVPGVGTATGGRVRRQCAMEGVEAALERRVQASRKARPLDGEGEARLTMLACSEPPEGQARWTLRPLADGLVAMEVVETISKSTVRKVPKKDIKPWLGQCRCIPPRESAGFVRAMEDVPETYSRDFMAPFGFRQAVCRISPTYHPNFSQRSRSVPLKVATQFHHGGHPERSDAIRPCSTGWSPLPFPVRGHLPEGPAARPAGAGLRRCASTRPERQRRLPRLRTEMAVAAVPWGAGRPGGPGRKSTGPSRPDAGWRPDLARALILRPWRGRRALTNRAARTGPRHGRDGQVSRRRPSAPRPAGAGRPPAAAG